MRVVCFRGKSNSGKSKTIKKILNDFFKIKILSSKKEKRDFCLIFQYKNKKIGICSYGDMPNFVIEKLTLFKNEGCNMVICASHKRGEIIDFIKREFEEQNIKFVDCELGETEEEYNRRMSIFKQEIDKLFI